jgi:membrane protein implicated in regulation of membrane protease activity
VQVDDVAQTGRQMILLMPIMLIIMLVWVGLMLLAQSRRVSAAMYIVAWLVLAILLAILTGSFSLRSYAALASRGVRTTGTVAELLPRDHASARYRYQVGDKSYEGLAGPREPNPPLEALKVGDAVVVYYNPTRPAFSVLGDPKPILENEVTSIAGAAIMFPTLIVLGALWHAHRERRRRAAGT